MNKKKKKSRNSPQRAHHNGAKTNESVHKIRYAVVGLGYIAQKAVLPAFDHAKNSELVALISSDPTKLALLSKKYKVSHTADYDHFENCMEESKANAVYIALPNSLHYEFAMRAFKLGLHVLCETPLATNVSECAELIENARTKNLKLMVAYRLHFDAGNLEAVKIASASNAHSQTEPKLGELKIFNSVFTLPVRDRQNIRLKEEMGGGTAFEIGIYCINAARYLFQSEPLEVSAFTGTQDSSFFSQVEESMSAIMKFPRGRLACFSVSFGASESSYYELMGSKGKLRVEPAYNFESNLKHQLTVGSKTSVKTFPKHDQFAAELVYFSNCILHNIEVESSGYEGYVDVQIIRALYESCISGMSIKLHLSAPEQRPSKKLEINIPPSKKARLIHATGPSNPSRI
jgi:glucose-fructose oxidoreductase